MASEERRLRQPFLDARHQTQAPFPQQFAILNDKGQQQLLQITLMPKAAAFIKANKIYSSGQIKANRLPRRGFSLLPSVETEQLVNDSPALLLVGVKHPTKHGPILILDLSVYQQSFYLNQEFLIASRYNPMQRAKHPQLPLQLADYPKKNESAFELADIDQDLFVFQGDSLIIEKFLAEEEEFYLYEKEGLVAVSTSMQVEQDKGRGVRLKGPGWVFFQTLSLEKLNKKQSRMGLMVIIYFCIITGVLQMIVALLL